MDNNLKFLTDNNCVEIYSILDLYLEFLLSEQKIINTEIFILKENIFSINKKLENNIHVPIDVLIMNNEKSTKLLRNYNFTKTRILEINTVMNNDLINNKNISKRFFKRVLRYFIHKEKYEYCNILNKIIILL